MSMPEIHSVNCYGGDNKQTFLAILLAKLSFTRQVAETCGKLTISAQAEVLRQIAQVGKVHGGNLVTGEGVTESNNDD